MKLSIIIGVFIGILLSTSQVLSQNNCIIIYQSDVPQSADPTSFYEAMANFINEKVKASLPEFEETRYIIIIPQNNDRFLSNVFYYNNSINFKNKVISSIHNNSTKRVYPACEVYQILSILQNTLEISENTYVLNFSDDDLRDDCSQSYDKTFVTINRININLNESIDYNTIYDYGPNKQKLPIHTLTFKISTPELFIVYPDTQLTFKLQRQTTEVGKIRLIPIDSLVYVNNLPDSTYLRINGTVHFSNEILSDKTYQFSDRFTNGSFLPMVKDDLPPYTNPDDKSESFEEIHATLTLEAIYYNGVYDKIVIKDTIHYTLQISNPIKIPRIFRDDIFMTNSVLLEKAKGRVVTQDELINRNNIKRSVIVSILSGLIIVLNLQSIKNLLKKFRSLFRKPKIKKL